MRKGILKISILILFLGFSTTLTAQYYFGRNKVQYHHFNWYVLKTPHFNVYYYPEMAPLAQVGAKLAEQSYKILEDKFNQSINRKVPLIFYSTHIHFEQTNVLPNFIPQGVGGFFEYMKGRVVIPANGSVWGFRHVIQHELVHVFTHSLLSQILREHGRSNAGNLPLWFVEGIAEFWSQRWDPQAEMVLRDAVVNGYIRPLEQIYQINGTFLMYKEGQAALKYISETYGDDKLLQLVQNSWKVDNFSDVMKLTIGKNYKEFDREWIYTLKKKYFPLLKKEDDPLMVTPALTKEGINTKPAFFLNNGIPFMAFMSNRVGYSNIYIRSLSPQKKKKIQPKILVKGGRTAEFEAFNLLQSKMDVSAGGRLAFVSKSGGSDALYIWDIPKNSLEYRFKFDSLVSISSPAWSPDEKSLCFSAVDFGGLSDLYVYRLKSGTLERLTHDFYADNDPVWTPDGTGIVFSSDRGAFGETGALNLFKYDLGTGAFTTITYGNHRDKSPVFSPDGKYLAFVSDRSGSFNIWAIRRGKKKVPHSPGLSPNRIIRFFSLAEDSGRQVVQRPLAKQLTHFVTGAFDPEWTDSGDILFTAFENFNFQIYRLKNAIKLFPEEKALPVPPLGMKPALWKVAKLSQTGKNTSIKYKRKYSLDVAQSYVMQDPLFGRSGGAQLVISDMLGNSQYYILMYNDAQTREEFLKSFNVAVTQLDLSHRTNFAWGLYHFAGRYFNYYEGFYYERFFGGFTSISYPLSIFRRVEANLNVRYSHKEWFGSEYGQKAVLISNYFSYVKDNSLWGTTGPVDGERFNFTLGNTVDVRYSNVNFYTLMIDFRRYFRLSRRVTYATRFMGRLNRGKETIKFIMGGSWDLRGYPQWSIWGDQYILMNHELRFPFIDRFILRFPFGGVRFSSIRGALFWDTGNAWDGPLTNLKGSVGAGIRLNLGGVLVLRFDYGKTFYTTFDHSIFKPRSFHLSPGRFKQFFFGWDF
ncbi:translocation protein TolB [bacterium BMS3Abin05]|nr:translocation protein TolB [bacterium BMS3Abin05]GBE27824.1 translocation protein TolB [bacterium BMS3Bbin03]